MQSGKMAHEFQFDKHIYTVGEQPPVFLNETPESVLGNIHQQLLLV